MEWGDTSDLNQVKQFFEHSNFTTNYESRHKIEVKAWLQNS
jgi:hypothetical protein